MVCVGPSYVRLLIGSVLKNLMSSQAGVNPRVRLILVVQLL